MTDFGAEPRSRQNGREVNNVFRTDEATDLGGGAVHWGIVAANVALPRRLRVGDRLAGVPQLLRQIFYVDWLYVVIVVGLFAGLCFGFAPDLAGASLLGRFLSAFRAGFWPLRIVFQIFYYDRELRRENQGLDLLYVGV